MRKSHLIYIAVVSFMLIFACSESDSPTSPDDNNGTGAALYYPGGVGSMFIFSRDTMGSAGSYSNIGLRTSSFASSRSANGLSIFKQINQTTSIGIVDTSSVEFWRSNNGVYFVVDTSGFAEILGEIPDSLKNLLTFNIDSQINAFSTPLTAGKVWPAFKLNVGIPIFGDRSLIEVSGAYKGQESVTVPPNAETKTAERIDYTVKISIPDEANILDTTSQYYGGTAWFVENIGLVKLEGNGLLINAIGRGSIDLEDSSRTIRETLTSFELK